MINYDLIKRNPKIFVGYSNITALHSATFISTGLTTFHGPMLISFVDTKDEFTWKYLFKVISSNAPSEIIFPKDQQPKVLRQGNAEGRPPAPKSVS
ncbi:MAG: LD-carboxypeptidase [Candidatus Marinimicrobia bacterium]|nr:LD-carboxypeptidase [Candidatus Neomarinimicrobiota bacterium]